MADELTEDEVALNQMSIDHFKRVQEMREHFLKTGTPFKEADNDNQDPLEGTDDSI